jgi:hypothetical protein
MNTPLDAELQEEGHLAEQREEALLQIKRERAQRLAVKRGLSETLTPAERPKSAGQSTLKDAILLRRGRSSTLQSQVSDVVPLRSRSSTLGSQSSGLQSPRFEERGQSVIPPPQSQAPSQSSLELSDVPKLSSQHPSLPTPRETELTSPATPLEAAAESEFSEFVQAEPSHTS